MEFVKKVNLDKDKELILELLNLPASIKGFGIVRRKNYEAVSIQRKNLLKKISNSSEVLGHAAEWSIFNGIKLLQKLLQIVKTIKRFITTGHLAIIPMRAN